MRYAPCYIAGMSTLSKYLETSGTTEEAFAKAVGITRTSVSRIKHGRQWPSRDTAKKIFEASDGSITEFGSFERASADGEAA